MNKPKKADERLASRIAGHEDAWALGVCGGLGKGCAIAIELGQPAVALAIIEDGLRRFRDRFEEELRVRDIDVAELGDTP